MKKILCSLVALSIFQCLSACDLERPHQDNFLVDASGIGGAALARELSSNLEMKLEATQRTLPDSDPAETFWLDGRDIMIGLVPLPDDRCNPSASYHSTYKEQKFRIDLVYKESSPVNREAAKRQLLAIVAKLRVPVERFSECPS